MVKLHSYNNAFTCSWYVSNTYHSPVNVHVTATYCIRSTTKYWSRLGRNRYGTDTYLPSSYCRSEYLFRTRSVRVPSLLVWRRHTKIIPIWSAIMLCYDGQLRNGSVATHFIPLSSTATSSGTSEYVTLQERPSRNQEPTNRNEEQTSNAPSSYQVLPQNLFSEQIYILPVLEHEILIYLAHLFHFHRK